MEIDPQKLPRHVAIIMDGNGRWAKRHGLKRYQGHEKGAESVRVVVRATRELSIPYLTLYAFSEENWKRSPLEVRQLMELLNRFLQSELEEMQQNGIRFLAMGRLYKLPQETQRLLYHTIEATKHNKEMTLILALSYGGRQEILDAVNALLESAKGKKKAQFTEDDFIKYLYLPDIPEPDLLIRTSGEMRISNFMLWQLAYTELYFTPVLWPDFRKEDYLEALCEYQRRDRRFGGAD